MRVKFCGITRLDDAEHAVRLGAWAIGLNHWEGSPRRCDDGVAAEFILRGTHEGELRGIPPTGKPFEVRTAAFFLFDGKELVCERVYFDSATILAQLAS